MRESQVTTQGAGFHSANSALTADFQQQTFQALANLATATKSDRSAVSNLTGTNSALTSQLATTNAKLNTALANIAALRLELTSR
jgi:enamine deaminase RidA (YjgF/YER057c/UK114 family)